MVFQYQYQYQYQLQRGLGITTYETFFHLIRDAYSNPIIVASIVALAPFVVFYLRDYFPKTLKRLTYLLVALPILVLPFSAYIFFFNGNNDLTIASIFFWMIYLAIVYEYLQWKRETPDKLKKSLFNELFARKKKLDVISLSFIGVILFLGGLLFTKSLFLVAVTSNSMAPAFWEADLILVQSISKDYQKGDIAVFSDPRVRDINVVHRIDSIEQGSIRTRGDNNNYMDDWVLDREDILGIAVTLNDKPITLKKAGRYFIQDFDLNLERDPIFMIVRNLMDTVRSNGPLYLVIIIMMLFLTQLQGTEKSKYY